MGPFPPTAVTASAGDERRRSAAAARASATAGAGRNRCDRDIVAAAFGDRLQKRSAMWLRWMLAVRLPLRADGAAPVRALPSSLLLSLLLAPESRERLADALAARTSFVGISIDMASAPSPAGVAGQLGGAEGASPATGSVDVDVAGAEIGGGGRKAGKYVSETPAWSGWCG